MKKSTAELLLKLSSDLYEKEAQDFSDTRKEIWEKEIIDFVDKIELGASVLDLGCGNGRLFASLKLKIKSLKYLGIDQSKELIEMAKQKYIDLQKVSKHGHSEALAEKSNRDPSPRRISGLRMTPKFIVGNGLTINFDSQFDYIICHSVLHHIPSEELQLKFLRNIHQALKPNHYPEGRGGKVLISVWNRNQDRYKKYLTKQYKQELIEKYPRLSRAKSKDQSALISALIREIGEADLLVPWKQSGQFRYIHVFTPAELKTLAQKAGFKNIQVTTSKHGQTTSIDKALGIYLIAEK